MSRRARLLLAALALLALLNVFVPRDDPVVSATTFGRSGEGHAAVFDLLTELGFEVRRSLEATTRLDPQATVWWIDPLGVCDARIAMEGEVDVLDSEDVAWAGGAWVRAGGTGVVLLESSEPGALREVSLPELVTCDAIAGIPLPAIALAGDGADDEGLPVVRGPGLPEARSFPIRRPRVFEQALDWDVVWEIETADGARPLALGRLLEAGTLIVVADSGFTHNRWLDEADAGPLALDLVRAYGTPLIDEREHGMLPETGTMRYIAASPALSVFVGLALVGALYAWRGTALPRRSVAESDPAVPTLETYVSSMSALYARTRDHGRVLERYRELTASRLARHFGLPHGVGLPALADRIRRVQRVSPARLEALVEPRPVKTAGALDAVARDLDRLVEEVTR